MDFQKIENGILTNRGNTNYMNNIISELTEVQKKYDWQMHTFLEKYIRGVEGLDSINDVDMNNPLYRFYKHKCEQYSNVTRMIKVAEAFKCSTTK